MPSSKAALVACLGVFHQRLPLLHFGLGGRADVDLGHAAGQLGQPLLQLLAIVVAGGGLDFLANLVGPAVDGVFAAAADDDRRVVGRDGHLLRRAEVGELDRLERHAEVLEDGLRAGQRGDVAEHGLAAVAVAGGLDGTHVQNAAQLVDHQRGQGLALDVLGDDQQRLAGLAHGFQQRNQVLGVGNLLFVDQDQAFFELDRLLVLVGDEMRREEAAVELHALDHVDVVSDCLPSSTVITPFLPTFRKASASTAPIVGSLLPAMVATWVISFLSFSLTGAAIFSMDFDHGLGGLVDAAAQGHRVGPGGDHPQPFAIDRLGQQRGGRGAVAGHVVGLRGGLLDQLGAQVLVGVVQVDLLGHGHAVLGDLRRAPTLVEHGIAAAGAQRADHGPGQLAHPGGQRLPGFVVKDHLFCHSGFLLLMDIFLLSRPQMAADFEWHTEKASGVPKSKNMCRNSL